MQHLIARLPGLRDSSSSCLWPHKAPNFFTFLSMSRKKWVVVGGGDRLNFKKKSTAWSSGLKRAVYSDSN